MLYVVYQDGSASKHHRGREMNFDHRRVMTVSMVQADGDELEDVIDLIGIHKYPTWPVVKWYGDTAKFIAGNLY